MSDTHSLISVVMVSFHTGAPLFQAIASVLNQPFVFELILVDNGNPPSVVASLHAVAVNDRRLHLLTGHGNIGFSRANNLGVAQARGAFVLLLNPDCVLDLGVVEKLLVHARSLAEPFMIGARIVNEDGSEQRGSRRALLTPATALVEALHLHIFFPHARLNHHGVALPETLTRIPAISGAFMFLSRASFEAVGGFDEGYFLHVEDLDLCFRFRKAEGEIYFAPDVKATHIGGTSEATSSFVAYHKAKGFVRYFHQHFRKEYPILLLWCLDLAIWMRYLLHRLTVRRKK